MQQMEQRKDKGRFLRLENLAGQQRVSEPGNAIKSTALDPALLYTSLAELPSRALSAWVCALLGAMEKTENKLQ